MPDPNYDCEERLYLLVEQMDEDLFEDWVEIPLESVVEAVEPVAEN